MERKDSDWIYPPEPEEEYEPDIDAINDEEWLRKKQEQEDKEEVFNNCYKKGDNK